MEKMNISEVQVFRYVKDGLTMIGYPDNIELFSYVGDEDRPMFCATYEINSSSFVDDIKTVISRYETYEKNINGRVDKHIKPLRVKDFVDLMNFGMMINGYDLGGIDIRVRDEAVCYSVHTNIATYGDGPRKNKRRR